VRFGPGDGTRWDIDAEDPPKYDNPVAELFIAINEIMEWTRLACGLPDEYWEAATHEKEGTDFHERKTTFLKAVRAVWKKDKVQFTPMPFSFQVPEVFYFPQQCVISRSGQLSGEVLAGMTTINSAFVDMISANAKAAVEKFYQRVAELRRTGHAIEGGPFAAQPAAQTFTQPAATKAKTREKQPRHAGEASSSSGAKRQRPEAAAAGQGDEEWSGWTGWSSQSTWTATASTWSPSPGWYDQPSWQAGGGQEQASATLEQSAGEEPEEAPGAARGGRRGRGRGARGRGRGSTSPGAYPWRRGGRGE
jgi:hypothetical protein